MDISSEQNMLDAFLVKACERLLVPDSVLVCLSFISRNGEWLSPESPNHAALWDILKCENSLTMAFAVFDFGLDREWHVNDLS